MQKLSDVVLKEKFKTMGWQVGHLEMMGKLTEIENTKKSLEECRHYRTIDSIDGETFDTSAI